VLAGVKLRFCLTAEKRTAMLMCVNVPPHQPLTLGISGYRISISRSRLRCCGYIPPEQWDEGINALLLNYNFTGSRSRDREESNSTSKSYFLGLLQRINKPWRLRDYSSWNYHNSDDIHCDNWQHINTYVERAFIPLKGRLTLGDSYTYIRRV
jgi:outer membrane usher protein